MVGAEKREGSLRLAPREPAAMPTLLALLSPPGVRQQAPASVYETLPLDEGRHVLGHFRILPVETDDQQSDIACVGCANSLQLSKIACHGMRLVLTVEVPVVHERLIMFDDLVEPRPPRQFDLKPKSRIVR